MAAVVVVIDKIALDWVLDNPAGPTGRYLSDRGRRLVVAAKAQAGVKTGALRASIHMRHMRDSRGQFMKIGSKLHYAYIHHEGSKPHLIVPKRAQTLRFTRGSGVIFAHSVRHPGTKPNRYLSNHLGIMT